MEIAVKYGIQETCQTSERNNIKGNEAYTIGQTSNKDGVGADRKVALELRESALLSSC